MKMPDPNEPAVLFVDDEPKSIKYFTMAFGKDFPVMTAASVAEAETILDEAGCRIGVLITDQRMPVETGVQLLDRAKQRYPTIMRLLTTAYADLADAVAAVNKGEIHRYILKPWDIEGLRKDLRSTLDLHKQKRAEQDLIQARRQTMAALASHIAHELATPVATIATAASGFERHIPALVGAYRRELAAGTAPDRIPDTILETLEMAPAAILESANRARVLISLLLTNVTAGEAALDDRELVSIASIIGAALRGYPFVAGEADLVASDGPDFAVLGSPTLLTHVLYNLIRNALYAVHAAGKGRVRILSEPGPNWNLLYVADTGTGIAPEVLPRVFDEFFSQKGPGRGTGMGLPFCRRVMRDIGGEIVCSTVLGDHTRMELRFPTLGDLDSPGSGGAGDDEA